MKEKLFSWLAGSREEGASQTSAIGSLLAQRGVSQEDLGRALQHRHLLRTRLVSTLVEEDALAEQAALEVLAQHTGLPGISLRHSIVDLEVPALPASLKEERLILPTGVEVDGSILVAAADPLDATEQQEIELLLGAPVQQHMALHAHLSRSLRACQQLRAQQPDATHLLGDEVSAEEAAAAPDLMARVVLPATSPEMPFAGIAEAPTGERCVLVASADPTRGRELGDLGCRIATAADGPTVLRLLQIEQPDLLIFDAQLPGRSGVELLQLLGQTSRFSARGKLLVVAEGLPLNRECLAELPNLEVVTIEAVAERTRAWLERESDGDQTRRGWQQAATAELFTARAALARAEFDDAAEHLIAALGINPMLGEAYLELARLDLANRSLLRAEAGFAWARDFGVAGFQDLVELAILMQGRGDRRAATETWQRAAARADDPEAARLLVAHAKELATGERTGA